MTSTPTAIYQTQKALSFAQERHYLFTRSTCEKVTATAAEVGTLVAPFYGPKAIVDSYNRQTREIHQRLKHVESLRGNTTQDAEDLDQAESVLKNMLWERRLTTVAKLVMHVALFLFLAGCADPYQDIVMKIAGYMAAGSAGLYIWTQLYFTGNVRGICMDYHFKTFPHLQAVMDIYDYDERHR